MKYFLIFLLLFGNTAMAYKVPSAEDRCVVKDCLCRVIPGKYSKINGVTTPERRMTVFFPFDSSEVSKENRQSINLFFDKFTDSRINISIIGYADGCGKDGYNKTLSYNRAKSVLSVVRAKKSGSQARIFSYGERSDNCPNYEDRRVDIVIHSSNSLAAKIERIPADVYLIDASYSMWEKWRSWHDIVNASVKKGSRVYVSMMNGCRNNQMISDISPQSGTEIWYSYWKVLEYMNPGELLLVVSDLQSNVPISRREEEIINRKVDKAGVIVYIVQ